jgi:hypothetical protein
LLVHHERGGGSFPCLQEVVQRLKLVFLIVGMLNSISDDELLIHVIIHGALLGERVLLLNRGVRAPEAHFLRMFDICGLSTIYGHRLLLLLRKYVEVLFLYGGGICNR